MICRTVCSLLLLLSFVPISRAGQPTTAPSQSPAAPPFDPELFEVRVEPKYLANDDAWDDYADRWRLHLNLALWAPRINGSIGKGDFETDLDVSFADLFDKLTLAYGLDAEVRKGRFAVILFGQYQHFEADAATARGFDADASVNFALIDIALAYQVLNMPGGAPDSRFSIEALAGFRWTYLSAKIEINEGPFAGLEQDREKNWFDPYVGTRLRYDFDRHWNVSALGTIGGFGVGSDVAWSAYGQLEYRFDAKWSFILGYRAISYDYEDDGFIFDVTMHGPVIGLGIRM